MKCLSRPRFKKNMMLILGSFSKKAAITEEKIYLLSLMDSWKECFL